MYFFEFYKPAVIIVYNIKSFKILKHKNKYLRTMAEERFSGLSVITFFLKK